MSAQFHNCGAYGYFENASEFDTVDGFGVLTAMIMIMNSAGFWNIALNSPLKISRRFWVTCRLFSRSS
jgi:hypothetical protein